MPLTPADVSNKLFGRQVRGYSVDEVDTFLDQVEAELTRLLTENAALSSRVQAAPAAAPPAAVELTKPEPVAISAGEPQEAALRTLLMAQRTADQAIAEARAEADKMLSDANARAGQVDQEVKARTTSALAELQSRQAELQVRIEDLKAFEREYRLRLKAYLESQLKDLDSRGGSSEGPGTGVPAAARAAAVGVMPAGVTVAPSPATAPAAPAAPAAPVPPPPVPARPPVAPPVASPAVQVAPDGFPQVLPPEWAELEGITSPAPEPPRLAPEPAPSGPPKEAPLSATPPSLRAVPPLSVEPQPMGPFTVVPPPVQLEQVDEGPEPPTQP